MSKSFIFHSLLKKLANKRNGYITLKNTYEIVYKTSIGITLIDRSFTPSYQNKYRDLFILLDLEGYLKTCVRYIFDLKRYYHFTALL